MTRIRRRTLGCCSRAAALAALLLALPVCATPARATPVVYHSESCDGVDQTPGEPGILGFDPNEPVCVYVVRGAASSSGTKCDESNDPPGDEICGADVLIEIQGDGSIAGFTGGPGVVAHPTDFGGNPKQIRMNVARAAPPPADPNPVFLGELQVDTTSPQPVDVVVMGIQIVNAARQLENIPDEVTIARSVPEPDFLLQLGTGLIGLAGLHRLRRPRGAP
jgi:uncharacterized protein YuzE